MRISVTATNYDHVRKAFARIKKMPSDGVNFDRIGAKAKQIILDRTERGIDVNGSPFQEYSKSYHAEKSEKLGVDADVVDLFDSGNMLGSLLVEADDVSATLYFADNVNNDKARKHNEGDDGMPRREFFGLSGEEKGSIQALARDDMNRFLDSI